MLSYEEGVLNDFFIATGTSETLKKKIKKRLINKKVMFN
jgi:hypothetical protein